MNEIKEESPAIKSLKKIFEIKKEKEKQKEKERQELKGFLDELEKLLTEEFGQIRRPALKIEIRYGYGGILIFKEGEWWFKESQFREDERITEKGSIVTSRPKHILESIRDKEIESLKIRRGEEEECFSIY